MVLPPGGNTDYLGRVTSWEAGRGWYSQSQTSFLAAPQTSTTSSNIPPEGYCGFNKHLAMTTSGKLYTIKNSVSCRVQGKQ